LRLVMMELGTNSVALSTLPTAGFEAKELVPRSESLSGRGL
jgi:hypothetical protein